MITCQWTDKGIVVRTENGQGSTGTSLYETIDAALEGVRILLTLEEEQHNFPIDAYPTAAHRDAEMLARGFEERLRSRS